MEPLKTLAKKGLANKDVDFLISKFLPNTEKELSSNCDTILYSNKNKQYMFTLRDCISEISKREFPHLKTDKIYPPKNEEIIVRGIKNIQELVAFNHIKKLIYMHEYNNRPLNRGVMNMTGALSQSLKILEKYKQIETLSQRLQGLFDYYVLSELLLLLFDEIAPRIRIHQIKDYAHFICVVKVYYQTKNIKDALFTDKKGKPMKYIMPINKWGEHYIGKDRKMLYCCLYSYFNEIFKNDLDILNGICRGLLNAHYVNFFSKDKYEILKYLLSRVKPKVKKAVTKYQKDEPYYDNTVSKFYFAVYPSQEYSMYKPIYKIMDV